MALIGNIEHPQNTKITALVWKHNKSDEIAFCDISGQLGCIDVVCKLIYFKRRIYYYTYYYIVLDS